MAGTVVRVTCRLAQRKPKLLAMERKECSLMDKDLISLAEFGLHLIKDRSKLNNLDIRVGF